MWAGTFDGHGGIDVARAVAVSPDGQMVFVTGISDASTSSENFATVAYSAATGTKVWAKQYTGTGGINGATSVAVSPDGSTIFVTGSSAGATSGDDFATVAYQASTGTQLWASRWAGPGARTDDAAAVAVAPGGHTVLVTGTSSQPRGPVAVTIAYNAATGAPRWNRQHRGSGGGASGQAGRQHRLRHRDQRHRLHHDRIRRRRRRTKVGQPLSGSYDAWRDPAISARSIAVAPGGSTLYINGTAGNAARKRRGPGHDYATIAYRASTGAQLWARRYNGTGNRDDEAHSVTIGPGGHAVYVTGGSLGTNGHLDYATIAYSSSGARLWVARFNGQDNAAAWAVRASANGQAVYVTGSFETDTGSNFTTMAYDAATGAVRWNSVHDGGFMHSPLSMALAPDGSVVYICGSTAEVGNSDYATVAYHA